MTERKLKLSNASVYPVYAASGHTTKDWQVVGMAPKGGYVRVLIGQMSLDDLVQMRHYIDRAIVRELGEMRNTMAVTVDALAEGWRNAKAAISGETPGAKP